MRHTGDFSWVVSDERKLTSTGALHTQTTVQYHDIVGDQLDTHPLAGIIFLVHHRLHVKVTDPRCDAQSKIYAACRFTVVPLLDAYFVFMKHVTHLPSCV